MKRVLLIDDKPDFGGIARHCHYLLRTLSSEYQFTVLASNTQSYFDICEELGLELIQAHLKTWKEAKECYDSVGITKEKFDLIHTHSTLFALDLLRAMIDKDIPIITSRHSVLPADRPYKEGYFLAASVVAMCRQKNNRLIVVSEAVKDAYSKLGAEPKETIVIPNAVADKYCESKNLCRYDEFEVSRKEDNERDKKFLFIGRLSSDKNPMLAVEAFCSASRRLKNISLDIIGDGPLRSELESVVHKYELQDTIRFLGFVENADELIPEYDILLNTSPLEACSYTMIESLMQARPVICGNCKGNISMFYDGDINLGRNLDNMSKSLHEQAVIFHNGDIESVEKAIIYFAEFGGDLRNIGKIAREHYLRNFNLEVFRNRHIDIYNSLLS